MKKMKAKVIELTKRNVLLRKIIRKILALKRKSIYFIRGIGAKIDEKLVIFYSFSGKSYSCSPKAIYEYMIKQPEFADFEFIWSFNEPEKYKFLEENKNTKVIKHGGKVYEKYMSKAKYWFFNYRVADHIFPKKGQIYIQCWHGTPLKKLGYDLINTKNVMNSQKEIRDKYKIDAKKFKYFISPSKFASEKFVSAWNLKNIGKTDVIVEKGYPRNDFLYNYTQKDAQKIKQKLNLPQDKKIILYAPTWRDNQHNSELGYTYKTQVDFDLLKQQLQEDYIILFRAHYLVANTFNFEKYKNFIYDVSNWDDINELYVISDLLITDYSSVFFDYANLKRPIIFYMYDFEEYKDELRGFYINLKELPGEITKTEQELLKAIDKTKEFVYDVRYKKFNEKYNYLDDGKATKRVVETIVR